MRPALLPGIVLLVASTALAQPAPADPCPSAGYDRIACMLLELQATPCGPRLLARFAARGGRAVAAARAAAERGLRRREIVRLQRARDLLFGLEMKTARLMARGRVDPGCGTRDQTLVGAVLDDIALLQGRTPGTLPVPGGTTTTTTTPSPAVSTTVTTTTSSTTSTAPDHTCGNGILERGEQCEGDTGGRTCRDLGFTGGTLTCGPDCYFDVSRCTF